MAALEAEGPQTRSVLGLRVGAHEFRERNSSKMAVLLLSYGSIGSRRAHSKRSAAAALFEIFPPSAKDLTRQALQKANLFKINFHISSLCQDRSGTEDFSANCRCFAAIFASGAFCNSS